jgi:transposase-like protein
MKTLQRPRKACPRCKRQDTRRSARRNRFERFLAFFLIAPYRCRMCGQRFWRFTLRSARQGERSAPSLSSGEIQLPPGSELSSQKVPS